jgi:hypothetical protein
MRRGDQAQRGLLMAMEIRMVVRIYTPLRIEYNK